MTTPRRRRRVLVIDVGGTHVKLWLAGRKEPVKIESGCDMTAARMARAVRDATCDWRYDVISIGYPGPVMRHRPSREPANLGGGWVRFNYERALGHPVRIVNDAALQALGSYEGGHMLFLGLGTGLGSTLVLEGAVVPMELAHLPYHKGKSYEDYLGEAGRRRLGNKKWRHHVADVCDLLTKALLPDYVLLGGGNVKHLGTPPAGARLGSNANVLRGGYRLWLPRERRAR
ncbi:MAG: ROK family protein [Gemmatimonadaceae bacterium]